MMISTLGLFLWQLDRDARIETARTMVINTIVIPETFYLFNSHHIFTPVTHLKELTGNGYVILAIITCTVLQIAYPIYRWCRPLSTRPACRYLNETR